ncbi:aminodeoxychorismate synthase [Phaeobacter gallaeciensis]|uniref:Aminodeoxychorismate synthase n=1 Tax=Phaeobacter gallaeciensis TaxID=60890 RepID=A0A1B0ZVS2_9RHOB|nr:MULTISPECIES: aminodeoxychorismate synthase component I [Phaeobacter]MDF1771613.1 aminodeoxychorismate synthase component I [Pseudophaeobacter sp. bin_em_oilr2.035]MEE2633495.1 aminodeoxychorismate synthase component I [Pseudomonadota bacterium]ANP38239.1 aminodeoxychorismate synthase [Phaeobacter gallaeciensis]MDE4061458.1 aminodeoxychorismate synthase component I [Phaeobacter gallaeciensis]MDE4124347.1 aminodeoxychorismate synthase component I [Phaeobacter gallaeciensis]
MRIRFDQGPTGAGTCFDQPLRVIRADEADQVPAALAALDAARRAGHWLAGYATYELGYALEPKLANWMPDGRRLPLICFGVYEEPRQQDIEGSARPRAESEAPARGGGRALPGVLPGGTGLGDITPRWSYVRYAEAFAEVNRNIGKGDIYQANLTFPIDAEAHGSAEALYAALQARQTVGHGVLVEQGGLPDLLSRSPELFFRTDASGLIETRPMKGTQPRSDDPVEDARRRDFLRQDEKNRAENLMIVDLLRNDISRVAETGSVHVPELFAVESYATVHQMVSLVRARLRPDAGLAEIFAALFPCGSITGAPKIRAMEILADLEPWPRDIYCGTIGWAAPDGASSFNVAIRTVMLEDGRATLNVGGGVVWDSTATSEYEEALWKARFAQMTQPATPPVTPSRVIPLSA